MKWKILRQRQNKMVRNIQKISLFFAIHLEIIQLQGVKLDTINGQKCSQQGPFYYRVPLDPSHQEDTESPAKKTVPVNPASGQPPFDPFLFCCHPADNG